MRPRPGRDRDGYDHEWGSLGASPSWSLVVAAALPALSASRTLCRLCVCDGDHDARPAGSPRWTSPPAPAARPQLGLDSLQSHGLRGGDHFDARRRLAGARAAALRRQRAHQPPGPPRRRRHRRREGEKPRSAASMRGSAGARRSPPRPSRALAPAALASWRRRAPHLVERQAEALRGCAGCARVRARPRELGSCSLARRRLVSASRARS